MSIELAVIPHDQTHLVVIGTTVRKPANIAASYLKSLAWQVLPKQVKPIYVFVDDGSGPETRQLLEQFVHEHGGFVWDAEPAPPGDFHDQGVTHLWTDQAMQRVGRSKDRLLEFARVNRAEAIWLCDADLICEPMTFASLWSVPEQVVAACYWTRWNKVPEGHPLVHAGPQVWLTHPYGLVGNGMEEWEFRRRLTERSITQVFGQGACTLIRREALMKGVSFAPWPGNTLPGIGQGEDRHFCMRAEALHLKMVADPWPDVFHVYHRPEDEALMQEWLDRFEPRVEDIQEETDHPKSVRFHPQIGDLVSLDLLALEPILTHRGWANAPAQLVRGRLGSAKLHPELEEAILDMTRGEERIVPVHFGLDYVFPPYRGQRRLIRVRLIDHKPMGFPPVIEDEILRARSGAHIDTTACTPELLGLMEEANG